MKHIIRKLGAVSPVEIISTVNTRETEVSAEHPGSGETPNCAQAANCISPEAISGCAVCWRADTWQVITKQLQGLSAE